MTQLTEWVKTILGALGTIAGLTFLACVAAWFGGVIVHARDHDTPKVVAVQEPVPIVVQDAMNAQEFKRIEMMLRQIQAAQVQLLETARKARTP